MDSILSRHPAHPTARGRATSGARLIRDAREEA
jgi:hypothetical protein